MKCYCYRHVDTAYLMADEAHSQVCAGCGSTVRITWSTDAEGHRWNRYEYSGLDGLLW